MEPAEVKQEDPSEAPVEVAVLPTSIRYNDTDNLAHPSVSALPPDTRVHANTPYPNTPVPQHPRTPARGSQAAQRCAPPWQPGTQPLHGAGANCLAREEERPSGVGVMIPSAEYYSPNQEVLKGKTLNSNIGP